MKMLRIAASVARTSLTLKLISEKGRNQIWDPDGVQVKSKCGDNFCQVNSKDPRASGMVVQFLLENLHTVTEYPKPGQSIEILDSALPKTFLSSRVLSPNSLPL